MDTCLLDFYMPYYGDKNLHKSSFGHNLILWVNINYTYFIIEFKYFSWLKKLCLGSKLTHFHSRFLEHKVKITFKL